MIQRMILSRFRGHDRTIEFGPGINQITGPNESGKSTIKEAIAFVWMGTDSVGGSPDHLISKGHDEAMVTIMTEKATITRRKKRASTSIIKVGRHDLPAVGMNQTELSALLKMSVDSFMSCWNVGYFTSMPQVRQVAVLGELAAIDRRELLKSMLPAHIQIPAKVKLANPKIDADAMATERRQMQNVKASDEGALKQVRAQLAQLSGNHDIDADSYAKRLNELNAALAAHDFYKAALSKYQTEKMRWGNAINRKGHCETCLETLRIPVQEEFTVLDTEIARLKTRLEGVDHAIQVLHKKKKSPPAAPKKPVLVEGVRSCDKCSQPITDEQFKRVMAAYEKELLEYNKEAREIANYNDKVEVAIKKGQDEWGALTYEIYTMESAKKDLAVNREAALKHKAELERELAEVNKITEPLAPEKPAGDEVALRKEQLEVNTALDIHRRQKTQLEQLKAQEQNYLAAMFAKERQILELSAIEFSLKTLPQIETQKILETLRVDGVLVELKDGCLDISSDGIPYPSLSSGRRMKCDIEFCKSLRHAAGPKAPSWLFTDNADLMDKWRHLVPAGLQVFMAHVDPNLESLTVIQEG